jgi:hypothetical protein
MGDATLTFAPALGQSNVTANGDIVCRVPPEANATLRLNSMGASIAVNVPGMTQTVEQRNYELKLGNGEVPINLTAQGDIAVVAQPFDADAREGRQKFKVRDREKEGDFDFDFDFDLDFDMNTGAFASDWAAFGQRFGKDFGERLAQRAREAAERAASKVQAKAERKAERAARRAEERARQAERHAEAHARRAEQRWGADFGPRRAWRVERPPAPPEPPREPVSDEERLAILRMLEEKKITVEQAEQLLAALSGNQ